MKAPIARFLSADHERLAKLLQEAMPGTDIEPAAYAEFRKGLLRHIAMEEKILLPFARECCGGKPLPVAAKLRLDHGALTSLLVPTPTKAIVKTIQKILEAHNALEEGAGGAYEVCDRLAGDRVENILSRLRAAPDVKTRPNVDSAYVMEAAKNAVERAGYELES